MALTFLESLAPTNRSAPQNNFAGKTRTAIPVPNRHGIFTARETRLALLLAHFHARDLLKRHTNQNKVNYIKKVSSTAQSEAIDNGNYIKRSPRDNSAAQHNVIYIKCRLVQEVYDIQHQTEAPVIEKRGKQPVCRIYSVRSLQDRASVWKRAFFTGTFLVFFTAYAFSARADTPEPFQTQATNAAVDAEIEAQKANTYVWVCDCIAGREVWSLKSLKQIEQGVQTKESAVQRLMSAPQRVTLPGGATYQVPALDRTTAFALVTQCR